MVMTRTDVQISISLEKKVHNIAQLIAIGSSVPTYRRNTIKADAHLRFAHSPSLELRQPIAEPCISFHRNTQSQGTVN